MLIIDGLSLLSYIVTSIVYQQEITLLALLPTVAFVPIGISFIITDYNKQKIFFSFGMFFCALVQTLYTIFYDYVVSLAVIIALAYVGLGLISITNYKFAKVGSIITICLIAECILDDTAGMVIRSFQYVQGNYNIPNTQELLPIYILLIILLHFLTYTPKKNLDKPKNIKLNTNIIDFKTLLEFIENQYNSGAITEEEYLQKRSEILSKL